MKTSSDGIFENRMLFPDAVAQERLRNLVGLDDHRVRLAKILRVLVNPDGLRSWAGKHHPGAEQIVMNMLRRPPLVILAGDVGSGKSALAECSEAV